MEAWDFQSRLGDTGKQSMHFCVQSLYFNFSVSRTYVHTHTHARTSLLLQALLCHTLVNKIKHLNHWGKTGSELIPVRMCVIDLHDLTVCFGPILYLFTLFRSIDENDGSSYRRPRPRVCRSSCPLLWHAHKPDDLILFKQQITQIQLRCQPGNRFIHPGVKLHGIKIRKDHPWLAISA